MVIRTENDTIQIGKAFSLHNQINNISFPLEKPDDLDPLIDQIGDARYVLLGEASHGTSDYYLWRARISKRLIQEKGFSFIAVEGDWPDCYEINRYIKGYPDAGENAYQVLKTFTRWPTWLWANWEIAALTEWLRQYNRDRSDKAGFFGLDVYSLWESMDVIMDYLIKNQPDAAELAKQAYRCFEPYGEDEQAYAWSTRMVPENCEKEVVRLLQGMRDRTRKYDGESESAFSAEQNALVMVNAERYYRAMVRSDTNSWNVRDTHMADTLDRLMEFHGPQGKAIIWAHNTHVGDARATDMAAAGMVNLGQLVRQRHSREGVVLVGFSSYHGSVIAGKAWGAPMEQMPVPEARDRSWEDILHKTNPANKMFFLDHVTGEPGFMQSRGHRAIGVVYNPEYERLGNYVPTILPQRYDAFLYIDESQSLHPLAIPAEAVEQPPDLYPWGV